MEVITIGVSNYNTIIITEGFPRENTNYLIKNKFTSIGGCSLTSAFLLNKWDISTTYIGNVGKDTIGNNIIKEMKKNNINTNNISRIGKTNESLILLNKYNGSKTVFSNNINNECIIDTKLTSDIILSDGELYSITKEIYKSNKDSIKVLSTNKLNNNMYKLFKESDYVIINRDIASVITKINIDFNNTNSLKEVLNKLESMYNTKFIITLNEKGVLYKVDDKIKLMSSIKVIEKDLSGVREVFTGAFIYGLANNLSLEKCLKIAIIASGLSTKEYGIIESIPEVVKVHEIYARNK